MALTSGGTIAISNVSVELARASTASTNLNETAVRTLFVKPTALSTIAMSDGYGKVNRVTVNYNFTTNNNYYTVTLGTTAPTTGTYIAGKTDAVINVGSNGSPIYLYSNAVGSPALTIAGGTAGDTITINNYGYILGCGGDGGSWLNGSSASGGNGGTGISIASLSSISVQINNQGYICGGGGGGGACGDTAPSAYNQYEWAAGGGGGAGGGNGGSATGTLPVSAGTCLIYGNATGGSPGGVGTAGSTGSLAYNSVVGPFQSSWGGGGGGRNPSNPTGGASGTAYTQQGGGIVSNAAGGGGAGGGGGGSYAASISVYFKSGGGGGFGANGGTAGTATAPAGASFGSAAGGSSNNAGGGPLSGYSSGGTAGNYLVKNGRTVTVSGGTNWGGVGA